jgi:hypothetical protein
MARGQHRNRLPRELIGRNLAYAKLYLKPKKKVARLLIKGDRGTLDVNLTLDEVAELLAQDAGDRLTFGFVLVEGTVAEMRKEFEAATRTEVVPV